MYECVNEDTGKIELVFVKTEENRVDIYTKNFSGKIMENHTEYLGKKEELD